MSGAKRLRARPGVASVFVTRDQEDAQHMADLIVVPPRGAIERVGTPRVQFQRPANRFVASCLGERDDLTLDGATHGIRPEKLRIAPAARLARREDRRRRLATVALVDVVS